MVKKKRGDIDFDHLGIGTALAQNRLVVPVNQREYAWLDKHIKALLFDFSRAITQDKKTYFLF